MRNQNYVVLHDIFQVSLQQDGGPPRDGVEGEGRPRVLRGRGGAGEAGADHRHQAEQRYQEEDRQQDVVEQDQELRQAEHPQQEMD